MLVPTNVFLTRTHPRTAAPQPERGQPSVDYNFDRNLPAIVIFVNLPLLVCCSAFFVLFFYLLFPLYVVLLKLFFSCICAAFVHWAMFLVGGVVVW